MLGLELWIDPRRVETRPQRLLFVPLHPVVCCTSWWVSLLGFSGVDIV